MEPVPNKPGVWYHITLEECPLCCYSEEHRERREGPKPERYEDRYEYRTIAYHCGYL